MKFFSATILLISFYIFIIGCSLEDEEPQIVDENPTEDPSGTAINLIDDELSYWYKWLGVPHHSVTGLPSEVPKGDGMNGTPLGRNDPKNVFTVFEMEGEKVIKVTGEIYGGLTTNEEYGNYHLKLSYKWGDKKWEPRLDEPRDTGILYHCTGENEDGLWRVFMKGLESQIAEGTSGDLFFIPNYDHTVWPVGKVRINEQGYWDPTAPLKAVGGGSEEIRQKRFENYESKKDSWTIMEVYAFETTAIHLVNGNVVMVVEETGIQQPEGTVTALDKGKIQLQSEGAEVYYKDITIEEISELPESIKVAAGL